MPESEDQKEVSNTDLRNSQFGGGLINAETVNAQRIGGDIWNVFFGQQTTPIGNPARPKNERILLAAVKEEVTSRLRQSLHNTVLINLGKESQPQQVKRPWDAEIKIGLKPAEPLPNTTTILQVFDSQEIAGKLLILGNPGSGKTTTQLELAQALVSRAEVQPDYPVPVLFNLSSWKDDRQSLADWLVAELKSKYGVSKKLGLELVNNRQLLPLLDGLDELEPQRQELCVHVINKFLVGETKPLSLVVCSRSEEYSNYTTQLQLNGAIYLQPLTNNQICDYLTSINYIELWSTISSDLELLELVKTPLLLSITVLASQEISVEEWQRLNSTADRIQYLLDAYVGRMLKRDINNRAYSKNKSPNPTQTRLWLVWLAKQMQRESKTEFLIEKIQPNWLYSSPEKWIYRTTLLFLIQLFFGVFLTLSLGLISGIIGAIVISLFRVFCDFFHDEEIAPLENFYWSWRKATKQLIRINLFSLIIIILWEFVQKNSIDEIRKNTFLVLAPASSLYYIFIYGFSANQRDKKVYANQGIRYSAMNFFILTSILLLINILNKYIINQFIEPFDIVNQGLSYSLNFAGGTAGIPCLQHFTLRLVLYFNGYTPWNYARFLNYCTERLFLQRVGGRYRFIHKLLQDHFAQMEFKRD